MLKHYLELIRHFRGSILLGAIVSGGLALALSLVLLRAMPIYESSVTLNMQPSEEELRFNSAFMGVSQFNPATIIAQTHVERLLSRPVARRAVDILIEQSGGSLPPSPPSALDRIKASIWKWYNILNYGYFDPQPEMQTYISDLINATSVEIVEGSYILVITISHENPVIAARAANSLAQAYVEETRAEFGGDAARVDASLQRAIDEREAELNEYLAERQDIADELGFASVEGERTILLDNRSRARAAVQDARMEQELLDTEIATFEESIASQSDAAAVRELRANLAETRSSRSGVEARLRLREQAVEEADTALRELDSAAESFAEIDERIAEVEADLEELRSRRLGAQLAREAQLTQIRTIDEARVPVYPTFPKVLVNTVVATFLGAILVLVPVAAMDVLGDRARTSEDLRRLTGERVLPPISPKLLRQARAYNSRGGRPGRALRRFCETVGRRFVSTGPRCWPARSLYTTAYGSPEDVARVQEVMSAVMKIGAPEEVRKSASVTALPPMSGIADFQDLAGHHVVIGVRPGSVDGDDLSAIGQSGRAAGGPETFAAILQ